MSRFAPPPSNELSAHQNRVRAEIANGPRKGVPAPFEILLRSPAVADAVQKLGVRLRYETSLPPRLSELLILITASHWECTYEWEHHAPIALRAGVRETDMASLASGRTPEFVDPEAAALYGVVSELLQRGEIGDSVFERAKAALGEVALIEAIAIVGYYSMLALTLNAFEIQKDFPSQ